MLWPDFMDYFRGNHEIYAMENSMFLRVIGSITMLLLLAACGKSTNVQTYILNISEETEVDVSVGLPLPELTQEVIDNDLVVGYIKFKNDPYMYTIPRGTMAASGHPEAFSISVSMRPGHYDLLFRDADGNEFPIFSDQLDLLKVVIIEGTHTTTREVIGNL